MVFLSENSSNLNSSNPNSSNPNSSNPNSSNPNSSAASDYINELHAQKIQTERALFGNIFSFIPDGYIKYFNIFVVETVTTLFFALVYYYFMVVDFDKYYFVTGGYPKKHFAMHKFLTALYMSINFQTTTAYVDLKIKSYFIRSIVNIQLVLTVAILFFFAMK